MKKDRYQFFCVVVCICNSSIRVCKKIHFIHPDWHDSVHQDKCGWCGLAIIINITASTSSSPTQPNCYASQVFLFPAILSTFAISQLCCTTAADQKRSIDNKRMMPLQGTDDHCDADKVCGQKSSQLARCE